MKRLFTSISLVLMAFLALGQNPNTQYDDVVVLVNANDTTSLAIGQYFKNERNIPKINLIQTKTAPAKEQIDSLTFEILLQEIRDSLNARNLDTGINYLVTTKGMPLGVSRDTTGYYAGVPYSPFNASLESELTLLNSPGEFFIGDSLAIQNPYAGVDEHHAKQQHGIYLVSRLDGYSLEGIKTMIDNSGPQTIVIKDSARFVFDQDPSKDGSGQKNFLNKRMDTTHQFLRNRGWQSVNDTDTVYLTNQSDVLGYSSWGSNDAYQDHYTQNGTPSNKWKNGSFAVMNVSTSARSFDTATSYGQSLIADLLDNGCTGAAGYVYEPFAGAILHTDTFFARYTDNTPNQSYTLSESYFMASPFLSWMDVLVGDPKTTLMACEEVTVSAGTDSFICRNGSIRLTGKSNVSGADYQWHSLETNFSDSSQTTTVSPDTTQSFVLTLQKSECVKKDTVRIQVLPEPFDAGPDTVICFDEQLKMNPSVSDSNHNYHWSPESLFQNPNQRNPQIQPDTPTLITLELIKNGCISKDSLMVDVRTSPVNLPNEFNICKGDTVNLQASADTFYNGQYRWYPNQNMTDTVSANTFAYPDSTTTYHVELSNNRCMTTDSTTINVTPLALADFGFSASNLSVTLYDSSKNADSVRWHLGTGDSSTGTYPYNYNHIYNEADTFLVCQEVWNQCFRDSACRQIITRGVGIAKPKEGQAIQIYPNPARKQVVIEALNGKLPGELHLVNSRGRTVLSKTIHAPGEGVELDVSKLGKGLYFIESPGLKNRYKVVIQ